MNNSLKLAKKLNEELKNIPLFVEFFKVEKEFNESNCLNQLRNEMKFLKKCNMNEEDLKKYKSLKNEYDSNPLVKNYLSLKEEVEAYKKEVLEYLYK